MCFNGFRKNYLLHSVCFRSLVDLGNKGCARMPLVNIYIVRVPGDALNIFASEKKRLKCLLKVVR